MILKHTKVSLKKYLDVDFDLACLEDTGLYCYRDKYVVWKKVGTTPGTIGDDIVTLLFSGPLNNRLVLFQARGVK